MVTRMGLRIITALQEKVFAHLLAHSTTFHDANPVGRLIARTESDAETMKELFSRLTLGLLMSVLLFAGSMAVMLNENAWVTIRVFAVLVPILGAGTVVFLRIIRKLYREGRRRYADLSAMLTEYVQGVPVVQQMNQKERALRLLDKKNLARFRVDVKAWYLDYSFWGAFWFIEILAMAGILWLGADAMEKGTMTLGMVILFLENTRRVFQPIIQLGEQLNEVQRGLACADRIFDILDTEPAIRDAPGALDEARLDRELRFEDVSYSYTGEERVLRDVSFTVGKGERVAVVGPSGGGKSTIVGLLCRFLDPTGGRIMVDGRDLREFTQRAWRSRIGLVLQEIYLFPGSVLDNLRVLDETVPPGKVEAAARAVRAHDFVTRLPRGYDTDLAERGGNLSLGERQLLSFARALAADPELLVLDEATSSVDPHTERRIQESLERLLAGRTAVIVAHRLSTIRSADRILVVGGGRIVESGRHEELYARGGLYRSLYDLQVTGNDPGREARP